MQQPGEERREFQRLGLDPPVPGTLGSTAVSILEIGVLGARFHHAAPLVDQAAELRFSSNGQQIGLRCEVVRTRPSRDAKYPANGLESGVRFVSAIGESGQLLRDMLAGLVTSAMQARVGRGTTLEGFGSVDGDKTVRGADASFLSYRLEGGVWSRRRVFLPEQPATGFTVGRVEDSDEMQRLCRVYQASDEEGRRLIRMFAELSVSDVLQIPPKSS